MTMKTVSTMFWMTTGSIAAPILPFLLQFRPSPRPIRRRHGQPQKQPSEESCRKQLRLKMKTKKGEGTLLMTIQKIPRVD